MQQTASSIKRYICCVDCWLRMNVWMRMCVARLSASTDTNTHTHMLACITAYIENLKRKEKLNPKRKFCIQRTFACLLARSHTCMPWNGIAMVNEHIVLTAFIGFTLMLARSLRPRALALPHSLGSTHVRFTLHSILNTLMFIFAIFVLFLGFVCRRRHCHLWVFAIFGTLSIQ